MNLYFGSSWGTFNVPIPQRKMDSVFKGGEVSGRNHFGYSSGEPKRVHSYGKSVQFDATVCHNITMNTTVTLIQFLHIY